MKTDPKAGLEVPVEDVLAVQIEYPALSESAQQRGADFGRVYAGFLREHQRLADGFDGERDHDLIARFADLPRAVSAEENLHIEFAPPRDAGEFAARLQNMLDDPAKGEAIGRANVAAMQMMTLDATCRRYVQLFDDAIARRK